MSENYESLLVKTPKELFQFLFKTFKTEIPQTILTINDMNNASQLLLKLTSDFSYLVALSAYAKLCVRDAKRNKSKEEWEDMVDRKEVIDKVTEMVKQNYTAVSRAVTIKQENNKELFMNSKGYIE